MTDMMMEALEYASKGWYVFPCREKPGESFVRNGETITPTEKQPYTPQGLNNATLDLEQIREWWKTYPDAMIGINAGKSGLFVVDIDRKHVNGLETFSKWDINDTAGLHSITPSGGMHIIFSGSGKSSTNAKTGIDTRGEGGYFIAPPSKIIEGEHIGEYKRMGDWSKKPGIIPDGLMAKLFPDKTVEYVRGNSDGVKQLSRATLNFLAFGASAGERNTTLFKVFSDFAGCGYSREEAKEIVSPTCIRIGLGNSEIEQVLVHAYSKPRTSSIPDEIQEKIKSGGKNVASKITPEEQSTMENILLACMIVSNNIIPIVEDILIFEDFRTLQNRIIYKTILQLHHRNVKVDYITVSNEVSKSTDKISLNDIATLMDKYFVNTDNIITYANIIREKSSIRKIEALMDNKQEYVKSGNIVEIISTLEKDISDIAVYGGAKSTNVLTSEQATEMVGERILKLSTGQVQQLKTGFIEYDKNIGGLYENELIVCAARAGDGKSALALSIINDVGVRQQKPCVMFSLEMSTHESICRLICQLTGLKFKDVYQGKLRSKEDWKLYGEAMEKISASKIYFDDSYGMTVPELRSKIRKLMEKDIKLIVIDQLEQVKGYEGQPAYIQLDKIAYDIKNFTQEFNVPIILNHQLNRGITDRKLKNPQPQLSDLNQAGEKPANQVWAISHAKDEDGNILASKIKILKNRNGARIDFPVTFLEERMLFANPTPEEANFEVHHKFEDDDIVSNDSNSEPDWAQK